MSAIAIRPVSSLEELISVYTARGYQLLIVSDAWNDVRALATRLAQPTNTSTTLVVSSLARRVHESRKRGIEQFAGPTLVIVDEAHLDPGSVAWNQIQQAARESAHDIVFVHVPAASC